MKAAIPVGKDTTAQQDEHKKKQRREQQSLPLREKEYANAQTRQPNAPKIVTANQATDVPATHDPIPAVHGSQPAYAQGSGLMHGQLKASLEQTGDLNHPDTQKKEMDYKMTLSISELRDYHDIKSASPIAKNPVTASIPAAKAPDTKEAAKTAQNIVLVQQTADTNTADEPLKSPDTIEAVKTAQNTDAIQQPTDTKNSVGEAQDAAAEAPQTAAANPGFMALQEQIGTTAKAQQKHEPASRAAQDAQAAAPSPANERQGMAQAGKVNTMDAQKPGMFSVEDFKAQLKKKIDSMKLPANEEQADDFEKNNNIKEVNSKAMGDVKQQQNAASGAIATATAAKPDVAAQPVRPVAKMPAPNYGKTPGVPNVTKAMPAKRDAAAIEKPLQAETASIDEQMKTNGVTDTMLANSNEPSFTGALDEKNKAKTQSQAATTQFRTNEGQQLDQTRTEAQGQATGHIGAMHTANKSGVDKAQGDKKETAGKDTAKRKEVADHINGIYNTADTEVKGILKGLDSWVANKFEQGSKAAKAAFEKHVETNMKAYKKKRYGDANKSYGVLAAAGLWLWDKATGLPDEVNKYFVSGKKEYIDTMNIYINEIAIHVVAQLNAAKTRIAVGKKSVQDYVNGLSPSLRKLGREAINDIQAKFDKLEQDVNSKKDALIDVLAKKYVENMAAIDARIEALKAENSGFINRALGALAGVFAFIIEIKNTLTSLLAKIIEVVGAIIADPIGFFKNLIAGVGQGFSNFITNIWTHLQTGFIGWLTGAMKGITFTMPEDVFSLQGVFSIAMQVLGLGWQGIRAIGAAVVGEPLMKVLETGVEIVQIVRKDGIAGLWEYLKDQFQDLKQTVMDAIMDIIQTQVIQAGIKWIMGLLSPVGAFVKAVMAIIDVVKFFIQRAAQIAELVKAFTDSVSAIASGKVGAVAASIENALAKAVPVLIGLLASVLGISGLADKVLAIIRKIRQRITNGITKFWNFVKEKGKGLLSKVGNLVGKKDNKTKEEKKKEKPQDKRTLAEKQKDLDKGVNEGTQLLKDDSLDKKEIQKRLEVLEDTYDLQELKIVIDKTEKDSETLYIYGKVNPDKKGEKTKKRKHSEYTPKNIELKVTAGKVVATYEYDKAAHDNGKQNFTVIINLDSVEDRKVTQTVKGKNLVLKPEGKERGYHVSAGSLARDKHGLNLDSAHILADQFLGTGYKDGLNLLLTSSEFNQKTMKEAEEDIKGKIEDYMSGYLDNIITFDMTVEATFEVLIVDKLIERLHEGKPKTEQDKEDSMTTLRKLNVNQDPRRCEKVDYKALIKVDGVAKKIVQAKTKSADKWLDNLFGKNK